MDETPINEDASFFSVKIDGEEYNFHTSDSGEITPLYASTAFMNFGIISISPIKGDKHFSIALQLKDNKVSSATGTFTNEFSAAFFIEGVPGVWDPDHRDYRDTRKLVITTNNEKYIEGTFSFTGHNNVDETVKKFTEGSFRVIKI